MTIESADGADAEARPEKTGHGISFAEATRVWMKVAALSFGGPTGQIAVMHRILVDEKRWICEDRFLHALNYCMLLPGPEAQQLATYIGWLLHGTRGGLIAGTLFILPGALSILFLSLLYVSFHETTLVAALFYGLKPAVLAVVLEAVQRIGKRVLKNRALVTISVLAFCSLFFFGIPFPIVILAAGLTGWIGGRWREDLFYVLKPKPPGAKGIAEQGVAITDDVANAEHTRPSRGRTVRVVLCWGLVWFAPLAAIAAQLGADHVLVREGLFFSKAALVTFGGAYSVLGYVKQQAVEKLGWLTAGEMLDGLGMAETTPGPLIMVVQFVAFLGAYRQPGELAPMTSAVLGSLVATWMTFAPCFLWIFAGAPYIERLRGSRTLSTALSAITAAVVGVILNLAVWFALQTLFIDARETRLQAGEIILGSHWALDVPAIVLCVTASIAMLRFHANMIATLAACAGAGWLYFVWFRG